MSKLGKNHSPKPIRKSNKHDYFAKLNKLVKLLIQLLITAHLVLGSLKQSLSSNIYPSVSVGQQSRT